MLYPLSSDEGNGKTWDQLEKNDLQSYRKVALRDSQNVKTDSHFIFWEPVLAFKLRITLI